MSAGARPPGRAPVAPRVREPTARTTGAAFGSLALSAHPGTASMGEVLMISLVWTLVCALGFEPALLGPPEGKKTENPA